MIYFTKSKKYFARKKPSLFNLSFIFLASQAITASGQDLENSKIGYNTVQEKNESSRNAIYEFTSLDVEFLSQFSLKNLPQKPAAPSNRYADDLEVAKFGKKLFFDKRLSRNGEVACATCHQPMKYFTDGLNQSKGIGKTLRNAPSIAVSSYSPWQYWDGRKDSLWSQALSPLENPNEHGLDRASLANTIRKHYSKEYSKFFSAEKLYKIRNITTSSPNGNSLQKNNWQDLSSNQKKIINTIFSNIGKSLMAYQRQISLAPAPFDHFVNKLIETNKKPYSKNDLITLKNLMSYSEVSGLRLFMSKANCASCHNGPLFTNFEFHNIGAPEQDTKTVDLGRYVGVKNLLKDEFTCLSQWSDATKDQCDEMAFLKTTGPELVGAFKTPSLRNVAKTAPYLQAGQFETLEEVLQHYNQPKPPFYDREQHPNRPHFDILPLGLSEQEKLDIIAFLKTLTSPIPQDDFWWQN